MLSSRRAFALPGLFMAVFVFTSLIACEVAGAQGLNAAHLVREPEGRVMTLEPLSVEERAAQSLLKNPKTSQEVPEGFREFGTARTGQVVETKSLTLRFAAAATLTKIKGTPDFKVEQGGSCVEGYSYAANSTCTLLVRFTPQGPGRRVGKLEVTNSVDAKPLAVGIGGYGNSPTISFTPSIITTVPQTVSGGVGILSGATNLAVDGGDILYMADTGNQVVRYISSSGTLESVDFDIYSGGTYATDPQGIAVDGFDSVYVLQSNPASLIIGLLTGGILDYQSGSTACNYGSTCDLYQSPLGGPGEVTVDPAGEVFVEVYDDAYRLVNLASDTAQPDLSYIRLGNYDSYPFLIAVDASDTVYAFDYCFITANPYYSASADSFSNMKLVAGSRDCGFSGDGGLAQGAEIGFGVSQMVFDIAGNLYFTDTSNQRVRRIDGSTGIITTIAGNGATGYAGDGGPATSAQLNTPTGVAVDSQGQVYVISSSALTGSAQVVRKVGTVGALYLGGMTVGGSSTAQTVTVANTGNANLDFTHVGFSSGNTTDFAMDPNTTSCNFTVPLVAGRSCKIGFIFTPGAAGSRSAVLSITDDTVTNLNTIQLSGTGYTTATLTPASFAFANTNYGSTSAQQTATLTNTGKAAMTINSVAISGTNPTSFSYSTTCGGSLAAAASCTVSVIFVPNTSGALSAQLMVSDNAITQRQYVSLTGTGVAVAKASITPTSLTFASTAVGATTAAQVIKLSNTGDATLGITSISMNGSNAADYPFTKTCSTSLAAGGSCNISVSFKPTATGTRSGNVVIVTSNGTITAPMNGTSTAAAKPTKVTLSLPRVSTAANTGQSLELSAQVKSESSLIPTGTVQVWEGSHMWAETELAAGKAVLRMAGLPGGKHLLTAVYLGDANDSGSRSAALTVVAGPPYGVQAGAGGQVE